VGLDVVAKRGSSRKGGSGSKPSAEPCATYVYGLLRASKAPSLAGAPPGLPQTGPVRAFEAADGLWVIATDAPLDSYSAEAIEAGLVDLAWVTARATAHEQVVEHVMKLGTLVPMKLFTLYLDDARATADLHKRRRAIARVLDRIEGKVEWGIRVRLDADRAKARARERAGAGTEQAAGGAAFLVRKKKEKDAIEQTARGALAAAEDAFERLADVAVDAKRRPPTAAELGSRVVLDAAFLVERKAAGKFEAAAKSVAGAVAAEGGELVLTGPWPPYHFVAEDR
jgi:hypothetical protein